MEYVYYDVDRIKNFVFDSYRPREVAGASEIIKWLDHNPPPQNKESLEERLKKKGFHIQKIIYSRGGGGLLITANDDGEAICSWLEAEHQIQAIGGSLTAVHYPYNENFQTAFSILNYNLRQKKSEKAITRQLSSEQFEEKEKCDACGKRDSHGNKEQIHDEALPYCKVCSRKLEIGKQIVEALNIQKLISRNDSDPNKDLLIIYGDMNEVGAHLSSIENTRDLQDFSDKVYSVLEEARNEIKKSLNNHGYECLTPIAGGDDLVVFTHPGAFELVRDVIDRIEENLNKKLGETPRGYIKMNFSILISKHNFPIIHLFNISEELLRHSKERYYQDSQIKRTYYGFFHLWENKYRPSGKNVYEKSDFQALIKLAQRMQRSLKISHSSLYRIQEILSSRSSHVEKKMELDYYLIRHDKLKNIIHSDSEQFQIITEGIRMELTVPLLEDIIELLNLIRISPLAHKEAS